MKKTLDKERQNVVAMMAAIIYAGNVHSASESIERAEKIFEILERKTS